MKEFKIITDSCCDMDINFINENDIMVLPLTYLMDDVEYKNNVDHHEMDIHTFYSQLRNGAKVTTSMVNQEDFYNAFHECIKNGQDILCITFSSNLSGTYNSSVKAREEIIKLYPDANIQIVDSLSASMGQGLLVYYAAQMKKEGKSIEEIKNWLEDNKLHLIHLFTIQDLKQLARGGRLSYSACLIGSILKLKPILHVSDEGKLVPIDKVRGRQSAIDKLFFYMKEKMVDPENQVVFISHGDVLDEVQEIKSRILKEFPVKDVIIGNVGPVIGAHSGFGTIAIFFLGNLR